MRLDGKVHGTLVKNKDGQEIPEDEFVVFRPADNALLPTLYYYVTQLRIVGAGEDQVKSTNELIGRVQAWRALHPERCKVPDVEPGEIQT